LRVRRVSGGCIHPAACVRVPGDLPPGMEGSGEGRQAFVKWGPPDARSFPEEAEGLKALARRGGLRVPRVLAVAPRWIVLEYLPPGTPGADTDHRLGTGLAHLHRPFPRAAPPGGARTPRHPEWGSVPGGPGTGGSDPSPSGMSPDGEAEPARPAQPPPTRAHPTCHVSWPSFWRELRLEPQIARASGRLPAATRRTLGRLLDRMEEALAGWEADGLSLLHGDLWSGNVVVTVGGEPCLVDPAVYRGHREVDLAMMELFGGFGDRVFDAYRELRPLHPAYETCRREVYRLYPLLVHLNLFGSGYLRRGAGGGRALAALG
jgi:fructosamine-3-kinase